MADRERVIKALRIHRERTVCVNEEGEVCPYFSYDDCYNRVTNDALELLKEWEAVKPKIDAFGHPYCPKCKVLVYQTWRFCPHCGQAVKWE